MWGQQVIVDNRAGVAGVLGTAFVAKSPPDGHTLVQCNVASSGIGVTLFAKIPYDQVRDIAAVTRIGLTPNIITVHPSMPVKIDRRSSSPTPGRIPGKLSYSSGQVGTSPQLSMELVKLMAKIDIVNIPYKIGAQGITDNIAGQVPVGISNFPRRWRRCSRDACGRSRSRARRASRSFPTCRRCRRRGFPASTSSSWQGVCAPAATPAAVLDKINADINSVLRIPEIQARMEELVMVGPQTTREEFDQFIRAEIAKWAKVIKEAKIPLQ